MLASLCQYQDLSCLCFSCHSGYGCGYGCGYDCGYGCGYDCGYDCGCGYGDDIFVSAVPLHAIATVAITVTVSTTFTAAVIVAVAIATAAKVALTAAATAAVSTAIAAPFVPLRPARGCAGKTAVSFDRTAPNSCRDGRKLPLSVEAPVRGLSLPLVTPCTSRRCPPSVSARLPRAACSDALRAAACTCARNRASADISPIGRGTSAGITLGLRRAVSTGAVEIGVELGAAAAGGTGGGGVCALAENDGDAAHCVNHVVR